MGKNIDLLSLEKITKVYCDNQIKKIILDDINITFKSNTTYAITGPSGIGKSTLLHIAGCLEKPTTGNIFFNNNLINHKTLDASFFNQKIGFMFQFHYLIKEMTVLENISIMKLIQGISLKKAHEEALHLLDEIKLYHKKDAYPPTLSGGEQQRVSFLRAIINKPSFLFADEPTGSLDRENSNIMLDILFSQAKKHSIGIVICTHDESILNKFDTIINIKKSNMTIS